MLREMKQLGYAGVAFVALLGCLGVQSAEAQRRGARGTPGNGVERALRLGEEIGLSQEQRDQLEAMRVEILDERTRSMARLMELRSEVEAGMREPESIRQETQALRESGQASRGQLRERMESILTDEQREQLRDMRRPAAGGRQGFRGHRRGSRGARIGPGFDRRSGERGLRFRRRAPSN